MWCFSLSISINTFSIFGCNEVYHYTFFSLSAGTQVLSLTVEAVPVQFRNRLKCCKGKLPSSGYVKANKNTVKNYSRHFKNGTSSLGFLDPCSELHYCLSLLFFNYSPLGLNLQYLSSSTRDKGYIREWFPPLQKIIYFAIKNHCTEQKPVETGSWSTKARLFCSQQALDVFLVNVTWPLFLIPVKLLMEHMFK